MCGDYKEAKERSSVDGGEEAARYSPLSACSVPFQLPLTCFGQPRTLVPCEDYHMVTTPNICANRLAGGLAGHIEKCTSERSLTARGTLGEVQ